MTNQIRNIIQDLAKENFSLYPENYPHIEGEFTEEAKESMNDLAVGYWENRNEEEVLRDEKNEITLKDYFIWIRDECWLFFCEEFHDTSEYENC